MYMYSMYTHVCMLMHICLGVYLCVVCMHVVYAGEQVCTCVACIRMCAC